VTLRCWPGLDAFLLSSNFLLASLQPNSGLTHLPQAPLPWALLRCKPAMGRLFRMLNAMSVHRFSAVDIELYGKPPPPLHSSSNPQQSRPATMSQWLPYAFRQVGGRQHLAYRPPTPTPGSYLLLLGHLPVPVLASVAGGSLLCCRLPGMVRSSRAIPAILMCTLS
jgi:hypothetical protein